MNNQLAVAKTCAHQLETLRNTANPDIADVVAALSIGFQALMDHITNVGFNNGIGNQ